ncbi:DUF1127 domain-containing protein [Cognatishimia sp. F0-27]|uniref:DUF1127 domain-containing protein n=1 Tax=Cognatishimia sp. F0-27 TaxID=2816855 RepID=UPI001D0CA816|nr:DUF1127 domain-containing protein [Cognatishimia sp. F0-27]MCC1494072.1 DUF1127 domain-containing protein [Cognatishimia sp. F0-27]
MAYASNTTRYAPALSSDKASSLIASLRDRWARYTLYRRTLAELNGLSNRELADLGLSRAGLRSVAYEAVYGA